MENAVTRTCCVLGHREIIETEDLVQRCRGVIEKMIVEENVDTFLFGSKSRFNSLCYELVTEMKAFYPHIKRVYVRAEFPKIDDNYQTYLLERYEKTYYPEKLLGAGKAIYIIRNQEMIRESDFCMVYFREDEAPKNRKSGTAQALRYAIGKNKKIIRFP